MEWLIDGIKPKQLVPVHTRALGWLEERWPERAWALRYYAAAAIQ
jgi:hypothetical protein